MNPNRVYLTQTDTTVGFLSQSAENLQRIKARPGSKPFLTALDSFQTLCTKTRTPKRHRKRVRHAIKTTFILPDGNAYRVISTSKHHHFLKHFGWMYSTSANSSGKPFDENFAKKSTDVIIETEHALQERESSQIIRLGKKKKVRIRT